MDVSELAVNLTGKVVLVTGADGRLGYQVALAAARAGATVIASTRTQDEGDTVKKQIEAEIIGQGNRVFTLLMDLTSFANVSGAASNVLTHLRGAALDVVAHVAGTGAQNYVTGDGFIGTLQINVLSPALLTNLLLPALNAASAPRVVYMG